MLTVVLPAVKVVMLIVQYAEWQDFILVSNVDMVNSLALPVIDILGHSFSSLKNILVPIWESVYLTFELDVERVG